MRTVVVVGTGVAGLTTAATLRQKGYDGRLVLVGEEPLPPYRRTALSKEVLGGAKAVTEVHIERANTGMRSRSTGNSGAGRRASPRT